MRKQLKRLLVLAIVFVSCKEKKDDAKAFITTIDSPALQGSVQPFLFNDEGTLLMSWTQEKNDSIFLLKYAEFAENKWSEPVEIATGDNWFVNWADFSAIAAKNGNVLTHFLQKSDSKTFAYDIHLLLSNTNGNTWNNDFLLHTDSTKTEHGFVTLLPYKGSSFFVTWLDGRNTGVGDRGNEHSSSGAMNIRAATVLSSGGVVDDTLVDDKTCDCCQTSAAITAKGPIIVYRNRTDNEIRDIYISRLLEGSWSTPKPIHNDNWAIDGCPVNGPKATSYNNTLAVAWFTAANNIPKVKVAFSKDNGANFNAPILIDNGKPIGRVDVALLDEDSLLISWMESTKDGAEIRIKMVNSDGEVQKHFALTPISASRSSGFPQLEIVNNDVFVAWNAIENEKKSIKIMKIRKDYFSVAEEN